MEANKHFLDFPKCLAIDNEGRNGSLALLWSSEVSILVQGYSKDHILTIIKSKVSDLE